MDFFGYIFSILLVLAIFALFFAGLSSGIIAAVKFVLAYLGPYAIGALILTVFAAGQIAHLKSRKETAKKND